MSNPNETSLRVRLPDVSTEFWEDLFVAYRTPIRHYHTIAHVAEVAGHYDRVAADIGWGQPDEVLLAVLFHDAVYRAGASDNERASAEFARASANRWLSHMALDHQRVTTLIELTAAHGRLDRTSIDEEATLFLDCDMAILGADPDGYQRYADAVAAEFRPLIPLAGYRAGRRAFLERVLQSARIFLSDYFHGRLDAAARRNLSGELRAITAQSQPSLSHDTRS